MSYAPIVDKGSSFKRFVDTQMEINRDQFIFGIPEKPGSTYTVMNLQDLFKRLTLSPSDSTHQGIINTLAAHFDTVPYDPYPRRGVYIDIPDNQDFRLPSRDDLIAAGWNTNTVNYVGVEQMEFDANGKFIAPAAPWVTAGTYADSGLIYGQPDVQIDDGDDVTFTIELLDTETLQLEYNYPSVAGKQTPLDDQIKVYAFDDPEVIRTELTSEIYELIMNAGGYGFTWGRFKWDTHRWDNPQPAGLYPTRFDSLSLEAGQGNHYNGVLRKHTDLVPQVELSADGNIMLTHGQVMWDGLKLFIAGALGIKDNEEDVYTQDSQVDNPLQVTPATIHTQAPTSVLAFPLPAFGTNGYVEFMPYVSFTDGDIAEDVVNNRLTVTLSPSTHPVTAAGFYGFFLVDTIGGLSDEEVHDVFSFNYSTGVLVLDLSVESTNWALYDEVAVYKRHTMTVPADSTTALEDGGYYPLFQHQHQINYANAINGAVDEAGAYDPNIVDLLSYPRQIFAKHTKAVYSAEEAATMSTYMQHLNESLDDWTVNGTEGALIFYEDIDSDGEITITMDHTQTGTFTVAKPTWFYERALDGLVSTGIPKDTQKYDLERAIISLADPSVLTSAEVHATTPVVPSGTEILIVVKPFDADSNRVAGTDFIVRSTSDTIVFSGVEDESVNVALALAYSVDKDIFVNGDIMVVTGVANGGGIASNINGEHIVTGRNGHGPMYADDIANVNALDYTDALVAIQEPDTIIKSRLDGLLFIPYTVNFPYGTTMQQITIVLNPDSDAITLTVDLYKTT